MKFLLYISNYGLNNLKYLYKILDEYQSMNHDFDIIIDSTHEIKKIKDIQIFVYPEAKQDLTWKHRNHIKQLKTTNLLDYDYIMYSENDILITQENLDTFIKLEKEVPFNSSIGFMRYEEKNGNKYLIDIEPKEIQIMEIWQRKNRPYFTPLNLHQGCWLLSIEKFIDLIQTPYNHFETIYEFTLYPPIRNDLTKGFFTEMHNMGNYGPLEMAASEPYCVFGIKKYSPLDENFYKLLIHHLPNKYLDKESHKNAWKVSDFVGEVKKLF